MRGHARTRGRRSAAAAAVYPVAVSTPEGSVSAALHRVGEPWRPATLLAACAPRPEAWRGEVRGILNRLTPENSARLCARLCSLPVLTEAQLCDVARMVLEKAADEPLFSCTYASMCKAVASKAVAAAGGDRATVTLGELLSTLCAAEFDDFFVRQQPAVYHKDGPSPASAASCCRRRATGFVRFAAELCKLQLLSPALAGRFVGRLLDVETDVSLECLCRFLSTAGQYMDDTAKPVVDDCFATMSTIVADRRASLRLRFLLMDVLDLRQNGWQPRRAACCPKTLALVRQEAAVEALEKKLALSHLTTKRRSARRPGGRGGGSSSSNIGGGGVSSR